MIEERKRIAIGRNIYEARRRCGISQEELAERAGVDVEQIAYAESGKGIASLELLLEICDATGAMPNDILAGAYAGGDGA